MVTLDALRHFDANERRSRAGLKLPARPARSHLLWLGGARSPDGQFERGGVIRSLVAADNRRRLAAFTAMLAICGIATGAAEAAQARPRLPVRLILRDGQPGVVGESGTIVTIERDGRFRVARFVNERIEAPHRKGMLRAEAIRKLARTFARVHAADLPGVMSRSAAANAHRLQLSVGKRMSTLTLFPGETAEQAAVAFARSGLNPAIRFLDLWITAQNLVAREHGKTR